LVIGKSLFHVILIMVSNYFAPDVWYFISDSNVF